MSGFVQEGFSGVNVCSGVNVYRARHEEFVRGKLSGLFKWDSVASI